MRKIWMLRHGEREDDDLIIGISDVLLLPSGIEQARDRGIWLKDNADIKKIFSSPLKRCLQTTDAVNESLHVPVEVVHNLHERNLGISEGHPRGEESNQKFFALKEGETLLNHQIPGGESVEEAAMRFYNCVQEIKDKTDEEILIVAHFFLIKSFVCLSEKRPLEDYRFIEVPYCSLTEFDDDGEKLTSVRVGFTPEI